MSISVRQRHAVFVVLAVRDGALAAFSALIRRSMSLLAWRGRDVQ
ncbi:hypothetical protein [Mycetohabitans endofungorum]|nr:hypothetical protein [Mycetohabitans endofungorum]